MDSDITIDEVKKIIAPYANFFQEATLEQKDKIMLALGDSNDVLDICKNIKFEGAKVLLEKLDSIEIPEYDSKGRIISCKNIYGEKIVKYSNIKGLIPYDWIWLILFVTLLIAIAYIEEAYSVDFGNFPIFAFFIFNTIIFGIDEDQLSKRNIQTPGIGWGIILVPVYLWKRANILNTNRFVFYLLMFLFSLSGLIVLIEANMADYDETLQGLLLIAYIFVAIPNIIAFSRRHPYRWIIFLLTTVGLLFALIGWFIGLIWACSPIKKSK